MIDVYEIKFQDSGNFTIKICQENEHGEQVEISNVCLKYKETWDSALSEHVTNFFNKHGDVLTFEEERDTVRLMTVYKIVTEDGSRLTIDAIDKVKGMKEIIEAKKHH